MLSSEHIQNKVITITHEHTSADNMFVFRISSCNLKNWWAVSRDTFSLLAYKSSNILCFLSWYVSLNCCSSSSYCLLIWQHWSWNTSSSIAKVSINIFFHLSDLLSYGVFMASDIFITSWFEYNWWLFMVSDIFISYFS